jgi:hypothetical protein
MLPSLKHTKEEKIGQPKRQQLRFDGFGLPMVLNLFNPVAHL